MILQTQHLDSDTIAASTHGVLTPDLQSNAKRKKKEIIEKRNNIKKSSVNVYVITTIQEPTDWLENPVKGNLAYYGTSKDKNHDSQNICFTVAENISRFYLTFFFYGFRGGHFYGADSEPYRCFYGDRNLQSTQRR